MGEGERRERNEPSQSSICVTSKLEERQNRIERSRKEVLKHPFI